MNTAMAHNVIASLTAVMFQVLFNCYLFSSCRSPPVLAAVIPDSHHTTQTTLNLNETDWTVRTHQHVIDRVYQRNWLNTQTTAKIEQHRHYIGTSPPTTIALEGITTISNRQKRRAFQSGIARPACPFTTAWKILHKARNMNDAEVEVVQPVDQSGFQGFQYFYTQNCNYNRMRSGHSARSIACPTCCMGIDSDRFASRCEQQKSLVNALVRRAPTYEPHWEFVHINTGCMCAVS